MAKLRKIRNLVNNHELHDRVGVAMFLYARELDQSGEETPEKKLAQWSLSSAMQPDTVMLALVATDPAIIEAASESTSTNPNQPENTNVSLDNVTDEMITTAVENNWSRVAEKYVVTGTATDGATVVPSSAGLNPFLDPGYQASPSAEPKPVTDRNKS